MQGNIDQATKVREGEHISEDKLRKYLTENTEIDVRQLEILQYPGGFSNLTYQVNTLTDSFVLRRPPIGANIKSAHDMKREFDILQLLHDVYPKAPKPIHYCADTSIIGAEFYLMQRVEGVILRNKIPDGLALNQGDLKALSISCIDNLSALHQIQVIDTPLASIGKPEGYVSRQVSGWIGRYEKAATDDINSLNMVMDWMKSQIVSETGIALIHNDYKYDNLVLNPKQIDDIMAVLDWEMCTIGDPLMDLGTSLAYWAETEDHPALKPFNLTWLPGNLNREQVVDRYQTKSNIKLDNIVFYYVFGTFKVAVIAQQIYARYKMGLTQDKRFADLIHVVKACGHNASKAIKLNRISQLNKS
ncbi:phosphotransferase family protein [Penaeicola halotolerans]|uniref:phosphotransferase family protein n=1 Tax=Penaeicola halotolerans TaxID=2793196 RepID=UPI001CF86BB2|nr:phosphotransferase family protein [Penaeicola halotolerans]